MTILITIPDARLAADPRIGDANGKSVANIRVASNYRTKDASGEWTSEALFFDVALWRSADTVGEYFSKGSPIIVWGELRERSWTDKDGNQRTGLEVAGADWSFPPKNGDGEQGQRQGKPAAKPKPAVSAGDFASDDDIPF
jgi:single stranded DNA-binding protein